mmetsp:Transcript_9966/g.24598  ORF Transcript_9966/g.24598 Transcript_9966/m.24598 type:complete len:400 (+) Transcript_9966:439-1638(+)
MPALGIQPPRLLPVGFQRIEDDGIALLGRYAQPPAAVRPVLDHPVVAGHRKHRLTPLCNVRQVKEHRNEPIPAVPHEKPLVQIRLEVIMVRVVVLIELVAQHLQVLRDHVIVQIEVDTYQLRDPRAQLRRQRVALRVQPRRATGARLLVHILGLLPRCADSGGPHVAPRRGDEGVAFERREEAFGLKHPRAVAEHFDFYLPPVTRQLHVVDIAHSARWKHKHLLVEEGVDLWRVRPLCKVENRAVGLHKLPQGLAWEVLLHLCSDVLEDRELRLHAGRTHSNHREQWLASPHSVDLGFRVAPRPPPAPRRGAGLGPPAAGHAGAIVLALGAPGPAPVEEDGAREERHEPAQGDERVAHVPPPRGAEPLLGAVPLGGEPSQHPEEWAFNPPLSSSATGYA